MPRKNTSSINVCCFSTVVSSSQIHYWCVSIVASWVTVVEVVTTLYSSILFPSPLAISPWCMYFTSSPIAGPVIDPGVYPTKTATSCSSLQQIREETAIDVLQLLADQYGYRPLGLSRSYSAESCDQVVEANPDSMSGLYWIRNGEDPVQLQCNFWPMHMACYALHNYVINYRLCCSYSYMFN